MLYDSHNHLQSLRFGQPATDLIAAMRDVGVTGCVVNATQEADWGKVQLLAEQFPFFVRPAYGVHPWFADTVSEGWEERLRKLLSDNEHATVGEVGMDGWVNAPSMEVQRVVFTKQIAIAADLKRIMTVHCLKAWDELFRLMDETDAWPEKFLMHSFGGSIEVAGRLLKRGAWFSFSGYFLQSRKQKVLEVFKLLPKDRILLETDAPEMAPPLELMEFPIDGDLNHPANLRAIAKAFEKAIGPGALEQLSENSKRFWNL
ncbi:MAG: TatD family hydrolase [Akkermansiaceae bacterium]